MNVSAHQPNLTTDSSQGGENLGRRAARGGAVILASVAVGKLLNLLITAVLSRLLSPHEFGLFAMVLTFTAILSVFSDMGLTAATIQKRGHTDAEASAMFWLNLAVGCVLGFIAVATAGPIAHFYREPLVHHLTMWCALGFPVAALGSQHIALLVRRLALTQVAICEIGGVIAGGVAAIYMAYHGYGVQSLVAQMLVSAGTVTLLAWALSGWMPSRPDTSTNLRSMMRFGGYLTAFNFVNYLSRNLDNVLVGRFSGTISLGLYSRAYTLMMYPIVLISGPLTRVALPTLSMLQHDHRRLGEAYIRILTVIAFISFPLMTFLFVAAPEVILLLYGRDWLAAVPIFRVLCVAGMFQGIYSAAGQIFTATGRTDRMFRSGVVFAIVLCASFVIGLRWGAMGIATAYMASLTIMLMPYLSYVYRTIELPVIRVLRALAPLFVASIGSGIVCAMVLNSVLADSVSVVRFTVALGLIGSSYLLLLFGFWRAQLKSLFKQTIGQVVSDAA